LAMGEGGALPALRAIIADTGGTLVTQLDPRQWAAGVRQLMRSAAPRLLHDEPAEVRFLDELRQHPPRTVRPWNRVWVKKNGTPLAETRSGVERPVMAAEWNLGEGKVLAAAFGASPSEVESLARRVERPPRDPRFRVNWRLGPEPRVTITAVDARRFLNDLRLELRITAAADSATALRKPIPQTEPGVYSTNFPAARTVSFAQVRAMGRMIDRIALAGRYPPEFDAIGNDRRAMEELARRSGGAVIEPGQTTPLDVHWPPRLIPLASPLAAGGALLVALALVWWRAST